MSIDVRAASPGLYGALRVVSAPIGFAQSAVVLETLAVGDVVVKAWAEVLTAFNAGTTNVLQLGDGTTVGKYLGPSDVTEGTVGAYASATTVFKAEAAAVPLTATFTQSGTAATTGSAVVYALVTSIGE